MTQSVGADSRTSKRVVRQSALSGAAATIAVATGLLLDVATAGVFGAGADTDAFVAAARIPFSLTAILMVLGNQVLVPTCATWAATFGGHRERRLSTTVLIVGVLGGCAVAGLMMLVGDALMRVLAPGFDARQVELAAELLQVMVWTIPLTAGSEVLRAWLNARHHFVVPAAMTVVLNLTAAGIVVGVQGEISVLPVAYLIGAATQFLAMLAFALWRGFRTAIPSFRDKESGTLLALMTRPTIGAGLNPVSRIVETVIASFLPAGSVTILHYGNRLISAVGGTVLFRSVMIAVLPRLTVAYASQDRPDAARLTQLALRLMLLVSLPLTAVGVLLALPASEAVFGIGRFSDADARMLGLLLAVMTLSFPLSAVQRALLAPFYAVRDTRVPLRNTVYGVLANLVLMPIFVLPLWDTDYPVLGIGAAYVGAQFVNVLHAWLVLRGSDLESSFGASSVLRSLLAAGVAAAVTLAVLGLASLAGDAPAGKAGDVAVVVISGVAGLAAAAAIARQSERRGRRRRTTRGDAKKS